MVRRGVLCVFFLLLMVLWACATIPTGPLAEGEVRVARLNVPNANVGKLYKVIFEGIQKKGEVKITSACFTWEWIGGSESHCFGLTEGDGTATVVLRTMGAGPYTLHGHLRYLYEGNFRESNKVSGQLYVY